MPKLEPNQKEDSELPVEGFPLFSPSINFIIKEVVSLGGYEDLLEVIDFSEIPPLPILEARLVEVRERVYQRAKKQRLN